MKSFDEWWEENYMMVSADKTEAENIYNLGQQSKQAEVDELQKRIDDALYCLRKDVELYGMTDDIEIAINHLKGGSHES